MVHPNLLTFTKVLKRSKMNNEELARLRYPIGQFEVPENIDNEQIKIWIDELETLPERIRKSVQELSEADLERPYRPGGWNLRQLVHHIADSHHHSYVRFKWALTEENPTIKPYDEKAWSELPDALTAPIHLSLDHLEIIHKKLVLLLKSLSQGQLQRTFVHPDTNQATTVAENIGRYAWHGNHHLAHIQGAL